MVEAELLPSVAAAAAAAVEVVEDKFAAAQAAAVAAAQAVVPPAGDARRSEVVLGRRLLDWALGQQEGCAPISSEEPLTSCAGVGKQVGKFKTQCYTIKIQNTKET